MKKQKAVEEKCQHEKTTYSWGWVKCVSCRENLYCPYDENLMVSTGGSSYMKITNSRA